MKEWSELEGILKSPTTGKDIFHKIQLAKATFSLSLNTSVDGASTTYPGKLFQCLTTLRLTFNNMPMGPESGKQGLCTGWTDIRATPCLPPANPSFLQ